MNRVRSKFSFPGQMNLGLCALISVLVFNCLAISPVHAQDRCITALAEANKAYDTGLYSAAIALLTQCLPDGIPENERTRAYRRLAYCYLEEDDPKGADVAVEKLLKRDPAFKPDPTEDKPKFTALVETVRQRLIAQQPFVKKMLRKKWFLFGGGSLLTAGLVVVLTSGPPEPDLPGPPELP